MTMLDIQNLVKDYDGIKAVDNLTFMVEENSISALIGPNGSGKTTLFNIITGFLKEDKGKIIFNGHDISALSPDKIARYSIGRTFQNIRLFPQISVLENVLLGLKYKKGDSFLSALFQTRSMKNEEEENQKKALEILEFVHLLDKKDVLAENMSHGQRKLLDLARIIALDPILFLLDEPTTGLFPEIKTIMFDLLKQLKDRRKTILFIEHDLKSVMDIADKVIVLDHGKLIGQGTPEEIKNNQDVQKVYLGTN